MISRCRLTLSFALCLRLQARLLKLATRGFILLPGFCGIFGGRIAAAVAGLSGLITPTNNVLIALCQNLPTDEPAARIVYNWAERIGEDVDNDRRIFFTVESQWDCSIRCHISRPAGA